MRKLVIALVLAACSSPKQAAEPTPSSSIAAEPTPADTADQNLELRRQKEKDASTKRLGDAVAAANRGEFRVAIDLASKATALNLENHYAWFVKGQLENQIKDYQAAVESFSQATRVLPEDAKYQFRLGRAHWFAGGAESRIRAHTALERATTLDPKLHLAHYYLGLVYRSQGMPTKAAQSFSTCATLMPSMGLAYSELSKLYIQWRKLDKAEEVLNQGRLLVNDQAQLADIYYSLGIVLGMQGEWPHALWAYNESLRLQPENKDALRQRGFAFAEAGDITHAKADLRAFTAQGVGRAFDLEAANQLLRSHKFQRKISPRAARKTALKPVPLAAASSAGASKLLEVPEFSLPKMVGEAHRVEEMLVQGEPYLGRSIKVRGHIVWIYSCAAASRTPGMSKKALKKLLAEHPERCMRPHFFLSDAKNPKNENWIEVVDVPRKIRADEKEFLGKEVVDNWPAVPVLTLGSEVVVTGTWATRSPTGFINSRGLLVYKALETVP